MRWILLSTLMAAPCLGGEPPFAHIQRRQSLNPHTRRQQDFLNPRQTDFLQRSNEQPGQMSNEQPGQRQQPRQQALRPVMPQTQGMRPTGHPTYFMIF